MPFATLQMYKIIVVLFLIGIVCLMIGSGIATVPYQTSLICVASLFIFFLGFLNINVVVGIFILAMLLSPEATVGTVPGRDITIRIEDVVIILLTFIWMGQTAINKNLRLFSPTLLNRTIGLYCTVFILFTARGMIAAKVEPLKGTFYVLKYLEYFVIYFLAANIITSKKQMKIFIAIFLLTFTIVNVYAAMQIGGEAGRVSAPFEIAAGRAGEPNTLGGYQVLLLGITLGLFLYARSFGLKIFLGGLAVFTLWPFIHTYSRSSYMAIIPMYLSFIIFSKKSRLLLISILIIGIILSLFFLPHKVIDRIRYTFIPLPGDERATVHIFGVSLGPSASARIKSYREVLQQWKKTPVWGYGVTALGFVDSQYVRTLVELGVVGFIAFIVLLRSIFKNTLRIYRTSQDALFKGLALGFLAGHIGIIFHAMTANSFIIIRIMEPYWFLAAMVMAIPKLEGIDMTVAVPADGRKRNYFRNAIHLLVYGRTT